MKSLIRLLAAALIFLSTPLLQAQTLAKTLLWRISGKGLAAPSYLYGTMHLTDERVFRLGDSLYQAISQSEGFAAELDPRQITLFVVGQIKEQILSTEKINTTLSKKDFALYGDRLAEKLHKDKNEITTKDVLNEKNKWISEKFQSGKMETFLDAYLMDVARREGKWIGGVEMMEDQAKLFRSAVGKSDIMEVLADNPSGKKSKAGKMNDEMENMISVYTAGDLEGIAAIMDTQDSTEMDALLVKRNRKMAGNMDSLAHVRTTVFAVGAAHLPGTKGLLRLLKEKGFKVEPVFSSRFVKPAAAGIVEKPESWITVSDKDSSYTVSMPGQPEDLNLYGFQLMKVGIDIFRNTGFFTAAFLQPGEGDKMDSLADLMADRIFPKGKKRSVAPVVINGFAGKKYSSTGADGLKQGYLLHKDRRFYLAFAICTHPDPENSKDLSRFLASFQVKDPKAAPYISAASYSFVDSAKGYAMSLPAEPKMMSEIISANKSKEVNTDLYMCTDSKTGLIYLLGCNTLTRGRYVEDDSAFMARVADKLRDQLATTGIDSSYMLGPVRVTDLDGNMIKSPSYRMHSRVYLLNNRWYVQSIVYSGKRPETALKQLFASFRLIASSTAAWAGHTSPDSVFSAYTPSELISVSRYKKSTVTDSYNSADTGLAVSYDIARSPLPKFYWAVSDSAMWAASVSRTVGSDSLYYQKKIRNGEIDGIEILKGGKGSSLVSRYRMFLQGNEIFVIMTTRQRDSVFNKNSNRFFERFRFTNPLPAKVNTTHRAGALMEALQSPDSATAGDAMRFLWKASFTANDLDTVMQTMIAVSGEDKDKVLLANELYDAVIRNYDSKTFGIARRLYNKLADSDYDRREQLLRIMANQKDSAAFSELLALVKTSPEPKLAPTNLINEMSGSIGLLSAVTPVLLPMAANPATQYLSLPLLNKLIDSNRLPASALTPYAADIINGSLRDTANINYSMKTIYVLALDHLNSNAADKALIKYLDGPPRYTGYKALSSFLVRGKPVPSSIIDLYAADTYYRSLLYDLLGENRKSALFPRRYASEKDLALSRAWQEADEDYGDTLSFVSRENKVIDGIPSHIYIVRLWDRDPAGGYLGGYGPYPDKPARSGEKPRLRLLMASEECSPGTKAAQIRELTERFGTGEE